MKRAPFFNLAHSAISQPAKIWPDKCALELIAPLNEKAPPKSWTFKSLERDMLNTAEGFRQQGLNQGDVILLRLENGPNFIFAFFAAIAAGAIPVPLSPKITEGELAFFLSDTGAKWIIKSKTLPVSDALSKNCTIIKEETLEQWRAAHDDNFIGTYAKTTAETPAFLIYTSGTSSNPKGVLHAQRVILGRAPMKNGWHDINETDRVLHAGDFNWTYTLGIGLMDPWVNGATACLYTGMKTPETWPLLIDQAMPTIFAAVPGVYRQILKHSHFEKQQLSSLRHGLCAGEALPAPLKIKWQQETGIPLYEAMGQSEISTYVSTAPGITVPEGAKGRVQNGRKLAILPINPATEREAESPLPANEIGLIALHRDDPGLMLSYWPPSDLKLSGPFMRGPWFITGDLGSLDAQNNLTHHGRSDEIMNPSGYRVSPLEVEAAIATHPTVNEVAVYEKKVRNDLTIIEALIIPENINQTAEQLAISISEQLEGTLATYKRPKSYGFVTTLPRNKAGKILRNQLGNWAKTPEHQAKLPKF